MSDDLRLVTSVDLSAACSSDYLYVSKVKITIIHIHNTIIMQMSRIKKIFMILGIGFT